MDDVGMLVATVAKTCWVDNSPADIEYVIPIVSSCAEEGRAVLAIMAYPV
jgi:hypothetical protein